jgi:hypothetical protein
MTLQSNGPISLGDIRAEMVGAGAISLGSVEVRRLIGISTGLISIGGAYGKTYIPKCATPFIQSWAAKQDRVEFILRIGGLTTSDLKISTTQANIDSNTWETISNVANNTDTSYTKIAAPGTLVPMNLKQSKSGWEDSDVVSTGAIVPKVIPKINILGFSKWYQYGDEFQLDIVLNVEDLKYRRHSTDQLQHWDYVITSWSYDGGITWVEDASYYGGSPYQNISSGVGARLSHLFSAQFVSELNLKVKVISASDTNTHYVSSDITSITVPANGPKSDTPTLVSVNPTSKRTVRFKVTTSTVGTVFYSQNNGVSWVGSYTNTAYSTSYTAPYEYYFDIPVTNAGDSASAKAAYGTGKTSLPTAEVTGTSWYITPSPVVVDEVVSGLTKRYTITNNSSEPVELQWYILSAGVYYFNSGQLLPPSSSYVADNLYGTVGQIKTGYFKVQQLESNTLSPRVYVKEESSLNTVSWTYSNLPGYQEDGPLLGNAYGAGKATVLLRNRWINGVGVVNVSQTNWEVEIRDSANNLVQTRRTPSPIAPGVVGVNGIISNYSDLYIVIGSLTRGATYKVRTRQTNSNGTDQWSPYSSYTVPTVFSNPRSEVSTPDIQVISRSGTTVNFRVYNPINEGVWLEIAYADTNSASDNYYISGGSQVYVPSQSYVDVSHTYSGGSYSKGVIQAFLWQPSLGQWDNSGSRIVITVV